MRFLSFRTGLVAIATIAVTSGSTLAQTTIGPGSALPPDGLIANNNDFFGFSRTGQTFTVPSVDNVLELFRLSIRDAVPASTFLFEIFAWDGTAPSGNALFSAAVAASGPSLTDIDVGGLALQSGNVYLALVTQTTGSAWGVFRSFSSDYDGGAFVQQANDGSWSALDADAAFDATFSSVAPVTATPEPASMTLMATGIAGVAGLARRRRKAASAA